MIAAAGTVGEDVAGWGSGESTGALAAPDSALGRFTYAMAVISPIAVANRASPIDPAWVVTPCGPPPRAVASPMALNVLIIEITVPSNPTMVAILPMARIGASRKFSRGRISSSTALAMLRRIAATPCSAASSPAT